MESDDLLVFRQLAAWRASGIDAWLATVAATLGAAPRPVGSLFACNAAGDRVGSLSGGCIEEELMAQLANGVLAPAQPMQLEYGVTPEQNERLGLPCGGRLRILVEPWPARRIDALPLLIEQLAQRRVVERRLDLASGAWEIATPPRFAPLSIDATALRHCYGPRFQLLLIGAGEIARALAVVAQMLDYRVVVCDPRERMAQSWSLEGVEVRCALPDDVVLELCRDDHYSAVITLTHDPRIDDMALMEALRLDLFYVGALGSTRTSAKRRERLRQLDLDDAEIGRLHAPVGLDIGSKRPAEIAIAILAELTALRAAAAREVPPATR